MCQYFFHLQAFETGNQKLKQILLYDRIHIEQRDQIIQGLDIVRLVFPGTGIGFFM